MSHPNHKFKKSQSAKAHTSPSMTMRSHAHTVFLSTHCAVIESPTTSVPDNWMRVNKSNEKIFPSHVKHCRGAHAGKPSFTSHVEHCRGAHAGVLNFSSHVVHCRGAHASKLNFPSYYEPVGEPTQKFLTLDATNIVAERAVAVNFTCRYGHCREAHAVTCNFTSHVIIVCCVILPALEHFICCI